MKSTFSPYYDFFSQPISRIARAILFVSIFSVYFAFTQPLWYMSFTSNQYTDPLRMSIHINKLEGQVTDNRDDLREINSLNKYIGMRPLLESDFSEFLWLPFVVGVFVLLILRSVVFGRLRDLVDIAVLYLYFGAFSAWDFYGRLHSYGHDLDPTAPITVEPFMPPLYGKHKVANFWIESYPGGASYALAILGALIFLALAVALWRGYKSHKKELERLKKGEHSCIMLKNTE